MVTASNLHTVQWGNPREAVRKEAHGLYYVCIFCPCVCANCMG